MIYTYNRERVHVIILRSECKLKMENAAGALQDAMLAMKEIKFSDRPTSMYPFALLARSEAYYTAGDFELALIDFHNGIHHSHNYRQQNTTGHTPIRKWCSKMRRVNPTPAVCRKHSISSQTTTASKKTRQRRKKTPQRKLLPKHHKWIARSYSRRQNDRKRAKNQ